MLSNDEIRPNGPLRVDRWHSSGVTCGRLSGPKIRRGPLTFMPKVFLFAQFNAKITPRAYFGPAGAEVGRVQR